MPSRYAQRLALHTWTLDTTPLPALLRVARDTGWNAVELRHVDFQRCAAAGLDRPAVLRLVRASGLAAATLGTENGLVFAEGAERDRLLDVLRVACVDAVELDCPTVLISTGAAEGSVERVVANLRAAAAVAAAHGIRLAYEFNSASPVVGTLARALAVVERVDHPACGLLLDAYHLARSGSGGAGFAEVPPDRLVAFQYSDVPATPLVPGASPTDRLPPGHGTVRWTEVLRLLAAKGYTGYLSHEAPNPATWSRPAEAVAREAAVATRRLLDAAGT